LEPDTSAPTSLAAAMTRLAVNATTTVRRLSVARIIPRETAIVTI
jgi:hypothetical protein